MKRPIEELKNEPVGARVVLWRDWKTVCAKIVSDHYTEVAGDGFNTLTTALGEGQYGWTHYIRAEDFEAAMEGEIG